MRMSPPKGGADLALHALIFDSWFDPYRGVIVQARIFEGTLRKGQHVRLWSNKAVFEVETLGVQTPKPVEVDEMHAGEAGFVVAGIKNVGDAKLGDSVQIDGHPSVG